MFDQITDQNSDGETDATAFTLVQASPVSASVILVNAGSNTLNYHFQAYTSVGGAPNTWVDLESPGNLTNNSMTAGAVSEPITISSAWSQVRLNVSASGGSILQFSISRYFNRADGGSLPLVSY